MAYLARYLNCVIALQLYGGIMTDNTVHEPVEIAKAAIGSQNAFGNLIWPLLMLSFGPTFG